MLWGSLSDLVTHVLTRVGFGTRKRYADAMSCVPELDMSAASDFKLAYSHSRGTGKERSATSTAARQRSATATLERGKVLQPTGLPAAPRTRLHQRGKWIIPKTPGSPSFLVAVVAVVATCNLLAVLLHTVHLYCKARRQRCAHACVCVRAGRRVCDDDDDDGMHVESHFDVV